MERQTSEAARLWEKPVVLEQVTSSVGDVTRVCFIDLIFAMGQVSDFWRQVLSVLSFLKGFYEIRIKSFFFFSLPVSGIAVKDGSGTFLRGKGEDLFFFDLIEVL